MGRKLKLDIRKAQTKKAKLARKFKLDVSKGCSGSARGCCHMCSVGQRGSQWTAELGRQVSPRRQALLI